jgi:hypothetical protein
VRTRLVLGGCKCVVAAIIEEAKVERPKEREERKLEMEHLG